MPDITASVPAATTVNLVTADFTASLRLTIAHTGVVANPDLYFCVAEEDDEACDTDFALVLSPATEAEATIRQLGAAGNRSLNVTNIHATDSTSCKVTFPLNWARLGLEEEVFTAWKNFKDSWIEKYEKWLDPTQRTVTITEQKNSIKEDFTAFAEGPLKLIEGSPNLVQEDRDIFRLPERDRTRTARAPITEEPNTDLMPQAGARVKSTSRRTAEATRASIHPDADGVEHRWVLLAHDAAPPASPEACPHVTISSKAMHIMELGIANAGMRLHLFSRWINTSDAAKSGPYGQRMTTLLND